MPDHQLAVGHSSFKGLPLQGGSQGLAEFGQDPLVDVVRRYSNQAQRLDAAAKALRSRVERSPAARSIQEPKQHKLIQRIGEAAIAEIAARYGDGTPTADLMAEYGIGKTTVLNIVRKAGLQSHHKGLPSSDVPEAARLYESGLSFAQVGAHFGVSKDSIRNKLTRAGIVTGEVRRPS